MKIPYTKRPTGFSDLDKANGTAFYANIEA